MNILLSKASTRVERVFCQVNKSVFELPKEHTDDYLAVDPTVLRDLQAHRSLEEPTIQRPR